MNKQEQYRKGLTDEEANFQDAQDLNYSQGNESPTDPYAFTDSDTGETVNTQLAPDEYALRNAGQFIDSAAESVPSESVDFASTPDDFASAPVETVPDASAPVQPSAPSAAPAQTGDVQAYKNELKKADKVYADAEKAREAAINDYATRAKDAQDRITQWRSEREAEHLALKQDIQQLAAQKIDPNNYWNDKSGNTDMGKKVTAAIAIALGGIGAAMQGPGVKNSVLDIIDKAIDRDVDAQKANLQSARASLGDKERLQNTYYQMGLEKFKDAESASLMAKSMAMEKTANQIQTVASKLGNKEAAMKAQFMLDELRVKQAETDQKLAARATDVRIMDEIISQVNNGKVPNLQLMATLKPEQRAAIEDRIAVTVPGVGIAADKQSAMKIKSMASGLNIIKSNIARIQELRSKYGTTVTKLKPEIRAEIEQLAASNTFALKDKEGLGALAQADLALTEKAMGNPAALYDPTNYEKLVFNLNKQAKQQMKPYLIQTEDDEKLKKVPGFKPRPR